MVVPPWRINEVLDRAQNGPVCLENDFDLKLFVPELRRVIKDYDISFDPSTPVVNDGSLVDSLWQAAMDFYLEVGTLCTDTHRRILFTEDEIKEALKKRYHLNLVEYSPALSIEEQNFKYGPELYLREPDLCCKPVFI